MRAEEVKGTSVAYHSDYPSAARPAINVKVYGFDRETYERLAANVGEGRADGLFGVAEEFVARDWWEAAAAEAALLGLGPIEQEGRSGGWLVFSDGRDPTEFGGKRRIDWLRAYREMEAWCRDTLAEIPTEVGRMAEEMATAEAVAP